MPLILSLRSAPSPSPPKHISFYTRRCSSHHHPLRNSEKYRVFDLDIYIEWETPRYTTRLYNTFASQLPKRLPLFFTRKKNARLKTHARTRKRSKPKLSVEMELLFPGDSTLARGREKILSHPHSTLRSLIRGEAWHFISTRPYKVSYRTRAERYIYFFFSAGR